MMHVGRVASLLVLLRSATGIPTTLHTLDSVAAMQRGLEEFDEKCEKVHATRFVPLRPQKFNKCSSRILIIH